MISEAEIYWDIGEMATRNVSSVVIGYFDTTCSLLGAAINKWKDEKQACHKQGHSPVRTPVSNVVDTQMHSHLETKYWDTRAWEGRQSAHGKLNNSSNFILSRDHHTDFSSIWSILSSYQQCDKD